jgi:hypothetical protein
VVQAFKDAGFKNVETTGSNAGTRLLAWKPIND